MRQDRKSGYHTARVETERYWSRIGSVPGQPADGSGMWPTNNLEVIKKVTSWSQDDHSGMVPAMTRAAQSSPTRRMTCHAAIVARELGFLRRRRLRFDNILKEGMLVTVEGRTGVVYEARLRSRRRRDRLESKSSRRMTTMTGTKYWSTSGAAEGGGYVRCRFPASA